MSSNREYRLTKTAGSQGLTLHETPIPKPRGNEVLIKVHAVSLQYRDIIIATGKYVLGSKENILPCSDAAGEIVDIGADVTGWKKGDRVCPNFSLDHISGDPTEPISMTALGGPIDGVLTDYKALPAHCLVLIPEYLSYEEASTLPCAALTAYNALMGPVKVKGGDYVLVQGTGGVSIFGLQMAVASGAIVIATSSSDDKLQVAAKLGAKHLINYKSTPEWDKEVLRLTNGRGVDHVLEVGGPGTIQKSLNSVRWGGWVHTIGFVSEIGSESQANLAMQCLMKSATLRGVLIGSRHQFEDMTRLIDAVQLRPVIDKVFPFESAREAYDYLQSQVHIGKVVIKVARN